ncbi:hypothetical protein B296_00001575, partial [Ensete ventricosum]
GSILTSLDEPFLASPALAVAVALASLASIMVYLPTCYRFVWEGNTCSYYRSL